MGQLLRCFSHNVQCEIRVQNIFDFNEDQPVVCPNGSIRSVRKFGAIWLTVHITNLFLHLSTNFLMNVKQHPFLDFPKFNKSVLGCLYFIILNILSDIFFGNNILSFKTIFP